MSSLDPIPTKLEWVDKRLPQVLKGVPNSSPVHNTLLLPGPGTKQYKRWSKHQQHGGPKTSRTENILCPTLQLRDIIVTQLVPYPDIDNSKIDHIGHR